MPTYDAIVLGTGGVGSAACFHLARRGLRVLGLDRFPAGHDRGSSHGQTRIIRQAYFEHPSYVPLLRRSYQLWLELETIAQQKLFHRTGLIEVGPPNGVVVPGVLKSAQQHGLDVERLSRDEAAARFAGYAIDEDAEAVFEANAGYLLVEQCVLAHLREAQIAGAELHCDEAVVSWKANGSTVDVQTESSCYNTSRLVVTAGSWAADVIADFGAALRVVRKHLHWYANDDPRYRQDEGCPAFFYEVPAGYYYGFPQMDHLGVKVAEHSGGEKAPDPLHVDRNVDPQERRRVEQFLSRHLPGLSGQCTAHTVCMYTMSPDEHFIVDRHPKHDNVVLAAGLSGHGFKFASVLGEVLADLAVSGETKHPIDFLRCTRFDRAV